jgi:hypothetical protein
MRALMGLIKDRHGTYYAQRKVPERLQEAVARVLVSGRDRQVFLKKSLGTKSLKSANVAATHVLADFDRTLAEALLKERPVISSISDAQIKRMVESYYASMLASDEEKRREGTGSEAVFQSVAKQLSAAGIDYHTPFTVAELPEAGLSDREIYKRKDTLDYQLAIVPRALARGDITVIKEELDELLLAFQLNVDRKSPSYRKLGMAVLAAHVRALRDIERRNKGEPVETPQSAYALLDAPIGEQGGSLREALEGWKKERERPEGTVHEYSRAIEMFIQLHGPLTILEIKRSHARTFREALQLVPKSRRGERLRVPLSVWVRAAREFSADDTRRARNARRGDNLVPLIELQKKIGVSYRTVLRMRDIIKRAARKYRGYKNVFGAWPRSFMRHKGGGHEPWVRRKLVVAGRHSSQHT